jgi:hypothetical protein
VKPETIESVSGRTSHELARWAAPLAAWWLSCGKRLLWVLPFNLGVLLVLAVLLLRGDAEDPNANFEKSRAALLALTPPHVPDEENARKIYELAIKAKVAYSGPDDDNPLYKVQSEGESNFFERPSVLAFWQANAKAIGLWKNGAQKERCDWNINYTNLAWSSPSIMDLRQGGELLAIDARYLAHKGDHQGAAKSLAAIYKLARHIKSSPILINLMIASAVDDIADGALLAIINYDTPATFDDLAAYRTAILPRESPFKQLARSAEIENGRGLHYLDGMASGAFAKTPLRLKANLFSSLTYATDRHCYTAISKAIVDSLLRNEFPPEHQKLIDLYQTGPAPFSITYLPDYRREFLPLLLLHDTAILNDTALAFLQFRARKGHDPRTIDELVPEFLPAVPRGAINNEPVRIRRDLIGAKNGGEYSYNFVGYYEGKPAIRLYTLGPSGKDYGGLNDGSYTEKGRDNTVIIIPPPVEQSEGENDF